MGETVSRNQEGLVKCAGRRIFFCRKLSVIGISSQMHGILYVDKEGHGVSPYYTWKTESGNDTFGEETDWPDSGRGSSSGQYRGLYCYAAVPCQETGDELFYCGQHGRPCGLWKSEERLYGIKPEAGSIHLSHNRSGTARTAEGYGRSCMPRQR